MAEYIDIDQPLMFMDIHGREIQGTIRTLLKANRTEMVLADVAPVRHGKWEDAGRADDDWVCSECGSPPWWCGVEEDVRPEYCPWCGAKMDAEEQEVTYDPDKFFGRTSG